VGVMHAGQEARGKISDRHYGDTELSHTSTIGFVTCDIEICHKFKTGDYFLKYD